MIWSTNKIVTDLKLILGSEVFIFIEEQPDGGHYCRDIHVDVKNIDSDGIRIVGFTDNGELSSVDEPQEDIELVEIRTRMSDSRGGLPKRADEQIRKNYFKIVDYFNNQNNISVVDNLKDYF